MVPGRKPSPSPSPGPRPGPKPKTDGYNTACAQPGDAATWPFCDASLSHEQRLADLVPRISAAEAGSQLTARESSSLPRLGIPAYYYGTNALHAFREAPCVTGPVKLNNGPFAPALSRDSRGCSCSPPQSSFQTVISSASPGREDSVEYYYS